MATYEELLDYANKYNPQPQQELGVNSFNQGGMIQQEETPYQKMMRETYGNPMQQQEEQGILGSVANRISGQPQQQGAEEPSFLSSLYRGAMAQGIGTLGGQADFVAGATGSETLRNLGDSAQKAMQEYGRPHEYTANEIFGSGLSGLWKYLSDPNGAAYDIGGGLGSTAAMAAEAALLSAALPSSVAAAGTGAVAAFATRLGLKSVAGALSKGGTAAKLIKNVIASTPLEAASESGGTYREMTTDEYGNRLNPENIDMDKVQEAMAKNFVGNLGVLGASNLLESVGIGRLFGDKMRQGILGKVRDIGGFMMTNAGQNAWEEGAQTGTNLYAQGKLDNISQIVNPFEWNEEQQNAAAIGGIAGLGQGTFMGGAGHVLNKIAGPQQQEGNPAVNIQNKVTNEEFGDAVAIAKHDTSTNLVDRMRNLEGRIGHHASDGTNCARTIGLALAGTDYQDLINVDDFVKIAQNKGQLKDPNSYVPKPGDLAVVNDGNHIVMVSENGGTIQNGSSRDGVYESAQSPLQMFGSVKYYISTSDLSSGDYGVAGNLQGVNEEQRQQEYYKNLVDQERQRRADAIRDVLGAKTHEQEQQEQAVSEAQKYQQENASELGPISNYYNAFTEQELAALTPEQKQTLKNNFDSFYSDKQNWGHTAIEKVQTARQMYSQLIGNRQQTATVQQQVTPATAPATNVQQQVAQPTPVQTANVAQAQTPQVQQQTAPTTTPTTNPQAPVVQQQNQVVQQQQQQAAGQEEVPFATEEKAPFTQEDVNNDVNVHINSKGERTWNGGFGRVVDERYKTRSEAAKDLPNRIAKISRNASGNFAAAREKLNEELSDLKADHSFGEITDAEYNDAVQQIDAANKNIAEREQKKKAKPTKSDVMTTRNALVLGDKLAMDMFNAWPPQKQEEMRQKLATDQANFAKKARQVRTSKSEKVIADAKKALDALPEAMRNKAYADADAQLTAEAEAKAKAKAERDAKKQAEKEAKAKAKAEAEAEKQAKAKKGEEKNAVTEQKPAELQKSEAEQSGDQDVNTKPQKVEQQKGENGEGTESENKVEVKENGSNESGLSGLPETEQTGAVSTDAEGRKAGAVPGPANGTGEAVSQANDEVVRNGTSKPRPARTRRLSGESKNVGGKTDEQTTLWGRVSRTLRAFANSIRQLCEDHEDDKVELDDLREEVDDILDKIDKEIDKAEKTTAQQDYDNFFKYITIYVGGKDYHAELFPGPRGTDAIRWASGVGALADRGSKRSLGILMWHTLMSRDAKGNYPSLDKVISSIKNYYKKHTDVQMSQAYQEAIEYGEKLKKQKKEIVVEDNRPDNTTKYQVAYNGASTLIDTFMLDRTARNIKLHGWGLYFAKLKEAAEAYRAAKTEGKFEVYSNGKQITDKSLIDELIGHFAPSVLKLRPERVAERLKGEIAELKDYIQKRKDTIPALEKSIKDLAGKSNMDLEEVLLDASRETFDVYVYSSRNIKTADDLRDAVSYKADRLNREIRQAEEKLNLLSRVDPDTLEVRDVGEKGYLYEVDIPENDVLLDEQKKFGDQPEKVQKAIDKLYKDQNFGTRFYGLKGKEIYDDLTAKLGSQRAASEMLNKYGVEGISYNDWEDGPCFVVFSDKAVKMMQRYEAAVAERQDDIKHSLDELISEAKRAFKGAKGFRINRNDLIFTMPNGLEMKVNIKDQIILNTADEEKARKEHGLNNKNERIVVEGYAKRLDKGSLVALSKEGRKGTVFHETFHTVWDWVLTDKEKAAMLKHFTPIAKEKGMDVEEVMADGYRDWLLARQQHKGTIFGKLYQKVLDFVNGALRVLTGTENVHNIYQQIEEGKVWNRDAKGRFAKAEDGKTYTAEDGTKFSVNPDVNPDATVKVVDLTGKAAPRDPAKVESFVRSLIAKNTTFTDSENKAILSVLPKDALHVTYSSMPQMFKQQRKVRGASIFDVKNVIGNSVLIESVPNKKTGKKPNVRMYHRFYTPVKFGEKIYVVRIVAEEQNGAITIDPTAVNLYDVIVERKSRPASSFTSYDEAEDGSSTISIRDMLTNVKDFYGKSYFRAPSTGNTKYSVSSDISKQYPHWMDDQVVDEDKNGKKGQNTQTTSTISTYRKIGAFIKENFPAGVRVLDASSGLGLGTAELRNMGINVEDIEPYAGQERMEKNPPTFGGRNVPDAYQQAIKAGREYDVIISNAVLNVIPDDWRHDVLHNMAKLLAPGGTMFINVRGVEDAKKVKNKIELESPNEILVTTGRELPFVSISPTGGQTKLSRYNTWRDADGTKIEYVDKRDKNGNVVRDDNGNPKRIKDPSKVPYRVGKPVSGQVYFHKNYADYIVPEDVLQKAKAIAEREGFTYNCMMYEPKSKMVRFDEAPDFDTAREPITGKNMKVYQDGRVVYSNGTEAQEGQIWHHKWMWVADDYQGFDVEESKDWSRKWLKANAKQGKAPGFLGEWQKRLKEIGLGDEINNTKSSPAKPGQKIKQQITAYQRFYTKPELAKYVSDELGDAYDVKVATKKNIGTDGDTAVVVTKSEPKYSVRKVGQTKELPSDFSTRWPTNKGIKENPYTQLLKTTHDMAQKDPVYYEKIIKSLKAVPGLNVSSKDPVKAGAQILKRLKDNLLYIYNKIPEDKRERAKQWYKGGNRVAKAWGERYGISQRSAAAVIAVLSPKMDWFKNVTLAERLLDCVYGHADKTWTKEMSATADVVFKNAIDKAKEEIKETDKPTEKAAKRRAREDKAAIERASKSTLKQLLNDRDLRAAAIWIKTYDKTYNDHGYRVLTPEGGTGDYVENKNGSKTAVSFAELGPVRKALSILIDPSYDNTFYELGKEHKVRNFANNLNNPDSEDFATIDTHAVGASILQPVSQTSYAVEQNFGAAGSTGEYGFSGTYAMYYEACRLAAEECGVSPREMQSITWEGVRNMFPPSMKAGTPTQEEISEYWSDADKQVKNAKKLGLTEEEILANTRDKVYNKAVGEGKELPPFAWEKTSKDVPLGDTYDRSDVKLANTEKKSSEKASTYTVKFNLDPSKFLSAETAELLKSSNPELQEEALTEGLTYLTDSIFAEYDTTGELSLAVQGNDDGVTNIGYIVSVDTPQQLVPIARMLGRTLKMDSVIAVGTEKTQGMKGTASVMSVTIPEGWGASEVSELSNKLGEVKDDLGNPAISTHSTSDGSMTIVNTSAYSDEEILQIVKETAPDLDVSMTGDRGTILDKDSYAEGLRKDKERERENYIGREFAQRVAGKLGTPEGSKFSIAPARVESREGPRAERTEKTGTERVQGKPQGRITEQTNTSTQGDEGASSSPKKFSVVDTVNKAANKVDAYANRNVREPNDNTATGRAARAFNNTQNKNNAQTFTEWLKDRVTKFYREWIDKNDALHKVDEAIERITGKKLAEEDKIYNMSQGARAYAQGAADTLVQGSEQAFNALRDSLERGIDPKDKDAMDRLKELKKDFKYATMQKVLEPIMTKDMDRKYPDYLEKHGLNNWHDAFSNYLGARRLLELLHLIEDKSLQYITHDKKEFTDFIDRHPEYEAFRPKPFQKGSWRDQVQKMAQAEPALAEAMAKDLAKEYKLPKNVSRADLEAMVREAPKEFGTSAQTYYQLQRNMLTMMELGHLIPAAVHDKINEMYKDYCPLMIDYSDTAGLETAIAQFGRGADSIANVDSMLKHVLQLGSDRGLISPLESSYKSIQALTNRAERNKVAVHFVKTVANSPELQKEGILKVVEGTSSPDAKNCVFTALINGKKVAFQTTQELYGPIVGYDMPAAGIVEGFCRSSAQWLRYGATTSPSFIVRNFIRDTIFAGISSRNGFVPVVDSARGLWAYLKNKELRGEFDAMGVSAYNYFGSGKNAVASMEELMGEKDLQYLKEHPTELIKELFKMVPRLLEGGSELIEASTRMGEYMRARKNGKSMQEAALDARDVTLDFSRSGFYGQRVNMMVPFFNACLQGGDKMFNRMLFSKDPKVRAQTVRMVGLYIMLPSMILWALHKDEPWYEELDPHIKMNNWIIGKFRIPKPQEAGIAFGSGIEAMLDKIYNKDPKAGKEWRAAMLDVLLPNLIPTAGLPILEWITNYSIFRDKAIEGNRLKRLPTEMRYNTSTTEISKAISKAVGGAYGASPVKLDNTIRGYTGTLGMLVAQIPDAFFENQQNLPSKNATERMMVRDFFINDMNLNRTSEDFYNLVNAAQQQHAGYGKKGKPTPDVKAINKALRDVSKQQKDIQEITNAKGISQDAKRQMIDRKRNIIKTIQKSTLKRYGNKYDI